MTDQMRTKDQLLHEARKSKKGDTYTDDVNRYDVVLLEVLVDIRDQLVAHNEQEKGQMMDVLGFFGPIVQPAHEILQKMKDAEEDNLDVEDIPEIDLKQKD